MASIQDCIWLWEHIETSITFSTVNLQRQWTLQVECMKGRERESVRQRERDCTLIFKKKFSDLWFQLCPGGLMDRMTPKSRWRNPLGLWSSSRETWEMRHSQHNNKTTEWWVGPANKITLLCLCLLLGQHGLSCPPKGRAGSFQRTNQGNWFGWSEINQVHILQNSVTQDDKKINLHHNLIHCYGMTGIWSAVWLHLLLIG